MKKLVPDPPTCISPVYSQDRSLNTAMDYINKAIEALDRLPDYVVLEKQPDVGDALIDLKIGRAFLMVAMQNPSASVPA